MKILGLKREQFYRSTRDMVFVMRAEPTHIIISAEQMWNKLIQRDGWRQTPASSGSVLKK